MARNDTFIDAPPERVFAVLADADAYGTWVVGSKYIREADPGFPAKGSRFHHAFGVGPLTVKDHTEVVDVTAPRRLVLRAKARPFGTALVTLLVDAEGSGSRVTIIEDAGDPVTRLVFNPLTHLLVKGRNVESLRRLKELAEGPQHPSQPTISEVANG